MEKFKNFCNFCLLIKSPNNILDEQGCILMRANYLNIVRTG